MYIQMFDYTIWLRFKCNEKSAQRDANTTRAGCSKVQTPPAPRHKHTHRQDRLQYTVLLARAQCNQQQEPHKPMITMELRSHKYIHRDRQRDTETQKHIHSAPTLSTFGTIWIPNTPQWLIPQPLHFHKQMLKNKIMLYYPPKIH